MPLDLQPLELAAYWLIAVNFLAFAAFGIDKARTEKGGTGIGEGVLLALALAGGTPGAFAGRRMFGHKVWQQPFGQRLAGVALFQFLGAGALAAVTLGGADMVKAQLAGPPPASAEARARTLEAIAPDSEWHAKPLTEEPLMEEPEEGGWGNEWQEAESLHTQVAANPPQRAPYTGQRLIGCDAVRAAGRAPLYRGDPDYHPAMDRDNDGIACEPIRR